MRHPETGHVKDLLSRIHFACRSRHVADPETHQLLSAHQASILDHLEEDGTMTLSELASRMGVTASTMSLAIRRLVTEGYVDRRRDPGDGRRVCLRLTEAGARMKEVKSTLDPRRIAAMLDALSTGERATALRGLAVLSRAALSMPKKPHRESHATPAEEAGPPQMEKPS